MLGGKAMTDTTGIPPSAASPAPPFQTIHEQYLDLVWSSAGHLGAVSVASRHGRAKRRAFEEALARHGKQDEENR